MIIGGIAVITRGVRRMTADIDAVVRGDSVGLATLLRSLASQKIEPRISDAQAFARANLVLLMRHRPSGVDLDISLAWTAFELEALEERDPARYGAITAPMARAEDLVIFKAMAARPKDVEDAAALLALHPDLDLTRIRKRLAELAVLAEEPALVDGLEAMIAQARAAARPSRAKTTPRRTRRTTARRR
jgi:hypothetical protein